MESRLPLPTDNIYKFYALFGIAIFITSTLGVVFLGNSTHEKIYALFKDQIAIPADTMPDDREQLESAIERLIEIQINDRDYFLKVLGSGLGLGCILVSLGFWRWHTVIQPKQDEYFELQLKKLRDDVESANN